MADFLRINSVNDKYLRFSSCFIFLCCYGCRFGGGGGGRFGAFVKRTNWALLFGGLEGSCTSVEFVTKAFVSGAGRSWWPMDEEGHRHVQAKIYTVEKNNKKKKTPQKHCNSSKASSPYFSDRIRLIHSSVPTDFPPLSPQYPVLTLTQIITLALSLQKKLLFAPNSLNCLNHP